MRESSDYIDLLIRNERILYLVEGSSKDIIGFLMQDNGYNLITALKEFYSSDTFTKLSDEATGLCIESAAYIYELLKGELKMGR